MRHRQSLRGVRFSASLLAVALSAAGCSGANPPPAGDDPADAGAPGASPDSGDAFNRVRNGPSGSASGGGTGGSALTTGGSSGALASSGSGSGGSGSGSGSGSGGGSDLDASGSGGLSVDASKDVDVASADAGPCADESAWLTPMNEACAAVGEAPLVCDPIAAQVALNYAKLCNWAHNANRTADYVALGGAASGVGENIAAGAPTESIASAVASWVNEKSSYDYATNTCASGQMCGHYTQVIWKTTTAVGCAHVSCTMPVAALGGATKWDFSVCDYSPPGNYVGKKPY